MIKGNILFLVRPIFIKKILLEHKSHVSPVLLCFYLPIIGYQTFLSIENYLYNNTAKIENKMLNKLQGKNPRYVKSLNNKDYKYEVDSQKDVNSNFLIIYFTFIKKK